jgi:hypothetical protein
MTTSSQSAPLEQKLVRGGKSENEARIIAENITSLSARRPSRDEPMDKDNLLMQPVSAWEASDRRPPGRRAFFHPSPSYKQRYEEIDWNDSG